MQQSYALNSNFVNALSMTAHQTRAHNVTHESILMALMQHALHFNTHFP